MPAESGKGGELAEVAVAEDQIRLDKIRFDLCGASLTNDMGGTCVSFPHVRDYIFESRLKFPRLTDCYKVN